MAATTAPNDTLIRSSIVRALRNVCHTMLGQEAAPVAEPADGAAVRPGCVFGRVGFVGDINGLVHLCIPDTYARAAAAQLLGMSPGEVEMSGLEVVNDVIGEITNMTVGGFKNALCDAGHPCKLTLPTIVRGDNLSIAAVKSATRYVFHFDCAGHRLIADIQMKSE